MWDRGVAGISNLVNGRHRPILPARMVVFLDAPVPFIVGQLQLFLMLSTGGKKKGDCSGILSPSVTRDDNGMFCVGQSLRIRIGPLKGYICRVLAVRRSDVTVKLDSKHKIITVKSEHLSEVHERNPAIANGEDSGSVKPFRFLEEQDGLNSWMNGAALPSEDNKWNAGGSTERELYSNNISGKFPSELGNLTNLFSLDLCLNNLSGPIPDTLYKLQKLCFFDLSNNNLSGPIPTNGSFQLFIPFIPISFLNNPELEPLPPPPPAVPPSIPISF